ncbi:MAG: IclR family transcriptional regulator [Burkholderiaceae bacterium]
MLTIDKAIRLLDYFDESRPEIGLSEMSRISGLDKATTHRVLACLAGHGLLEQHPVSRAYRLGVGLLRLARIREATFPVGEVIEPLLALLTAQTDETSHLSLLTGSSLSTIGISESPRSNRVFIEPGLRLPFDTTASGLAVLAASTDHEIGKLLSASRRGAESGQSTLPKPLRDKIRQTRERGYAIADQTFEDEVYGVAVALWGADTKASGAVAVATPISRMNDKKHAVIVGALNEAAANIMRALGGRAPGKPRKAA